MYEQLRRQGQWHLRATSGSSCTECRCLRSGWLHWRATFVPILEIVRWWACSVVPMFEVPCLSALGSLKHRPSSVASRHLLPEEKGFGVTGGRPIHYQPEHLYLSGNSPGIQRDASLAGKARRKGARVDVEVRTPASRRAEVTRRAFLVPVPNRSATSPRRSSPR